MNLFALVNPLLFPIPRRGRYRSISVVGTWIKRPCQKVPHSHSELVDPLVVQWEDDGSECGDIAWSYGGFDWICSEAGRSKLEALGPFFNFLEVEQHRSDDVHVSTGPYFWPIPMKRISIDPVLNQLENETLCAECGLARYRFKLRPLILDMAQVELHDIFCIQEIGTPAPVYVTEALADVVQRNVTNLKAIHAGRIE